MPNLKISAMPDAPDMGELDLLTVVVGGVNYKITRNAFLTAKTGEAVILAGGTGMIAIFDDGSVEISGPPGAEFLLGFGSGSALRFKDDEIGIEFINRFSFALNDGRSFDLEVGQPMFLSWDPVSPGNWAPAVPDNVGDALERIATAVAGLLGGPIP